MTSEAVDLAAIRQRQEAVQTGLHSDEDAIEAQATDIAYLLDRVEAMAATLKMARAEIDRWGYGDFHYGSTPREQSVLDALAAIDEVLR